MFNDSDPANWTPAERDLAGCGDYQNDDAEACENCDRVIDDEDDVVREDGIVWHVDCGARAERERINCAKFDARMRALNGKEAA